MTARPQLILPDSQPALERPKAPRIAIAVPSTDEVKANFCMALATMSYVLGLRRQHYALLNTKGSAVHKNRNKLVAEAQRLNAAKILFIDSDMTFPIDAAERLLSYEKPIVGASYAQRSPPHKNLVVPKGNQVVENATGLVEVDRLPTGMLLIDMAVFQALKRPYFRFPFREEDPANGVECDETGEDYDFCDRARAAGFPVLLDVDLSLNMIHWGEAGWRLSDELCGRAADQPDAEIVEVAS